MTKLTDLGTAVRADHGIRRWCYRVYGMAIESDTEFPELEGLTLDSAAPTPETVRLALRPTIEDNGRRGEVRLALDFPDGRRWLTVEKIPGGYRLRFPEIADFVVGDGGAWLGCVSRSATTQPETLRHLVLDLILPIIAGLRGRCAIHATAVVTPRGAVAFTAAPGTGKSTLAASFQQSGCALISDDCLVLEARGREALATPAYPGTRLWGDSLEVLGSGSDKTASVAHYTTKLRVNASVDWAAFPRRSMKLVRLYRLVRESGVDRPVIEELSGVDAFMVLVSGIGTFTIDPKDPGLLKRQFRFAENLAQVVAVRRLRIPDNFAALPAVRAAVLADLENLPR